MLEKTLGVPLFQEQAMKVAIVGAGFTPDRGRRAAPRDGDLQVHRRGQHISTTRWSTAWSRNGYTRDFAERTFKQIEGFGSYGFPESHAASFAKIAYASSWMKCHHPDIFCAALLNAQPMGFYAPAQIVRDAREHGVEVRPVCINAQPLGLHAGRSTGEGEDISPLRLGLRMVKGLANVHAAQIVAARDDAPFDIDRGCLAALGRAGRGAGEARRGRRLRLPRASTGGRRLWRVRGLGDAPLPLFAAADAREEGREPEVALTPLTDGPRGGRGLSRDPAVAARAIR